MEKRTRARANVFEKANAIKLQLELPTWRTLPTARNRMALLTGEYQDWLDAQEAQMVKDVMSRRKA